VCVQFEYIMAKFAKETNAPEQMKKQKTNPTPEDYAALQAEIARLQKDLRHEKMRADVYSTMVDVAEEMFHIQIRKKRLAPSSRQAAQAYSRG